jgi:(5-formylfuran-3-yl)methyl phosphate synthase
VELRLLVSVRSAAEVAAALEGGADIIDAKEPSRGSLGAVSSDVLAEIVECVPAEYPLSIALGDLISEAQVEHAISALELSAGAGPLYLKLGFAGVSSFTAIAKLLRVAVLTGSGKRRALGIVAVAYADASTVGTPRPEEIADAAAAAGCAGVLLDTHQKNGQCLFAVIGETELTHWIEGCRDAGLLTAVAGSLDAPDLPRLSRLAPDIVGVRGAACQGGRGGVVDPDRVASLRKVIVSGYSASLQGQFRLPQSGVRETPEPRANSGFLQGT